MGHMSKNKEILERYIGLVKNLENLMTVPKKFWLIYELKITVNQMKSASRKQEQKDIFSRDRK